MPLISIVLGFSQTPVYTAKLHALCGVSVYAPTFTGTYKEAIHMCLNHRAMASGQADLTWRRSYTQTMHRTLQTLAFNSKIQTVTLWKIKCVQTHYQQTNRQTGWAKKTGSVWTLVTLQRLAVEMHMICQKLHNVIEKKTQNFHCAAFKYFA